MTLIIFVLVSVIVNELDYFSLFVVLVLITAVKALIFNALTHCVNFFNACVNRLIMHN